MKAKKGYTASTTKEHLTFMAEKLGFNGNIEAMVKKLGFNYDVPGICTNCGVIRMVEPDAENYMCFACGSEHTVHSMVNLYFYYKGTYTTFKSLELSN